MPRAYESKKRRVTTCTECKRRKQRCDRQFPCNHCLNRGTPEKCLFLSGQSRPAVFESGFDTTSLDSPKQQVGEGQPVSSISSKPDREGHETSGLLSQVGYQLGRNNHGQVNFVDELQAAAATVTVTTQQARPAKIHLYPNRIGKDKWTKYCQISSVLPDQRIVRDLIHVFFSEANWYFTVLDRYYFDAAHRSWLLSCSKMTGSINDPVLPDDLFFPALLQQVLAVAIQFVPEQSAIASAMAQLGTPPTDDSSQSYSDAGEAILDLIGRHHHSIIAVQADLMRCAWLKNSGHGARAWYSLGSAIRQAQDIGLHLEPMTPRSSEDSVDYLSTAWLNEHKRRLWACLFTWESHMALQLGRPCTIHSRDCTIGMLIDADMPRDPSRTLFRPSLAEEKPSTSSSQVVKYVLAQKIQKLMISRAFDPILKDYSLITATHQEVSNLSETLSPCLRIESPDTSWDVVYPDTVFHRLQIATIINSFLLSLHRPHVRSHRESFDAAIEAAKNVLDFSQILFEKTAKHQHKTFTLIFYTIDAGILAAAMMKNLEPEDVRRQNIQRCIHEAVRRLAILAERNTAAVAGEKALSNCLRNLSVPDHVPKESPHTFNQQIVPVDLPSQHHTSLEHRLNGHLEGNVSFDQPADNRLQEDFDIWDFLPKIDDSEDLLTAMTIDSGFTSGWLEQSLESLISWG